MKSRIVTLVIPNSRLPIVNVAISSNRKISAPGRGSHSPS